MAIRVNDLIDLNKLGKQFMLVEAPQPYTKFVDGKNTGEIEGYKYSIVLPEFLFEKIEVKIEQDEPSISQDVIEKKKSVAVELEGLQAFVYSFNNRVGISFRAQSIESV